VDESLETTGNILSIDKGHQLPRTRFAFLRKIYIVVLRQQVVVSDDAKAISRIGLASGLKNHLPPAMGFIPKGDGVVA
jgi:hypothetical protein